MGTVEYGADNLVQKIQSGTINNPYNPVSYIGILVEKMNNVIEKLSRKRPIKIYFAGSKKL
jgi:hypothetical protein